MSFLVKQSINYALYTHGKKLSITCVFLASYFLIKIKALKILIYDDTWLPYIHIYTFYHPRLYNTAVIGMNFMVPSCMKIMLFCLVLITNRLINLCLNLTCVHVLWLVEDCQTPLGGRLLEWVTLSYPGEKYPVALGIVSQSFVACSINFSRPITYRTEHAQGGPKRHHEGKTGRYWDLFGDFHS